MQRDIWMLSNSAIQLRRTVESQVAMMPVTAPSITNTTMTITTSTTASGGKPAAEGEAAEWINVE